MRNVRLYVLALCLLPGIFGCNKEENSPETFNVVTSPEFEDDLLFVNKNNFKILTDIPVEYSSADPLIKISPEGVIERITSGEVVPIDITFKDGSGKKTRIYALGATDDNHDDPYAPYHDKSATNAYNSYRQGWQTLKKLPVKTQSHAIILRHGDADNGRDFTAAFPDRNEPANWWKSCDPSIARQLNARGKARSAELGKIFRDLNYPITRVISSEFCRSVATAELINSGPAIKQDERINHPEHNTTGKGLFNGMLEVMKEQPVDNSISLLVLHHPVNEIGTYPSFPTVSPFTWTGAYVVSVSPDKSITYEGAISFAMFNYWRNLKLNRL